VELLKLSSNVNECKPLLAGGGAGAAGLVHPGRGVQVDPIKPTLKAPGTKRLKPEYDELLSMFGYNFNLRSYTLVILNPRKNLLAGRYGYREGFSAAEMTQLRWGPAPLGPSKGQ